MIDWAVRNTAKLLNMPERNAREVIENEISSFSEVARFFTLRSLINQGNLSTCSFQYLTTDQKELLIRKYIWRHGDLISDVYPTYESVKNTLSLSFRTEQGVPSGSMKLYLIENPVFSTDCLFPGKKSNFELFWINIASSWMIRGYKKVTIQIPSIIANCYGIDKNSDSWNYFIKTIPEKKLIEAVKYCPIVLQTSSKFPTWSDFSNVPILIIFVGCKI